MMLVAINPSAAHTLIRYIHIFISITFLLFSVWTITRSVIGLVKHKQYTGFDKFLSYGFIIALYAQLIFGLLLFTNFGPLSGNDLLGADSGARTASKRLWPIEHIVMMFFALLIATLGLILISKTEVSREKFKKGLIYFVISILIIAQSLCAIYLF
jgi:ammonia channel protein AmtB